MAEFRSFFSNMSAPKKNKESTTSRQLEIALINAQKEDALLNAGHSQYQSYEYTQFDTYKLSTDGVYVFKRNVRSNDNSEYSVIPNDLVKTKIKEYLQESVFSCTPDFLSRALKSPAFDYLSPVTAVKLFEALAKAEVSLIFIIDD